MNITSSYTVGELAEKLNVSRTRVHQLLTIYEVKSVKLGNLLIISKKEAQKIPKTRPVGVKITAR